MLWVPKHIGRLSYGQTELIHTIRRCGLTSGLKLCLDAGDANSYTSGQSWLDLSGNGYDFFLGATGGAEASDPTFNGTAGRRSSGEYWSFDGGDFFRYDSANETWMNNLHKDNAKFTLVAWVRLGVSGTTQSLMGTRGDFGSNVGMVWVFLSNETSSIRVANGAAEPALITSTFTVPVGVWAFLAASVDEAVGANGAILVKNETQELLTSTYTSPSASAASVTMDIGSSGGAVAPLPNTTRMGMFAAWEGVALTQTQLNALYMGTRGRFGA